MSTSSAAPELIWLSDTELEVDGQRYVVTADLPAMHAVQSTPERLGLAKSRRMVERFHERSSGHATDRVVELGVFNGGGAALLQQILRPKRLVAVDLSPEPVPALEAFVRDRGLGDVMSLHYGVDQADRETLSALIDDSFGGEQLDLVVDDASHWYAETRTSFEVLFPRLRPGGRYIVEDWAWAHFDDPMFQAGNGRWADRPALSNFVIEVMLIIGSFPDVITGLTVDHRSAEFVRGPRELPTDIRVGQLYLNRGRTFRPLL